MDSAWQRLLALTAADVMNRDVVQVGQTASMATAARALRAHHISGLPVLDEQQRLVGILSASDFLDRLLPDPREGFRDSAYQFAWSGSRGAHLDQLDEEKVGSFMSPAVQASSPETPVLVLARMMCAEHIHRIPIVDSGGRVLGMVTTLDLVAALLNAMDESRMEAVGARPVSGGSSAAAPQPSS